MKTQQLKILAQQATPWPWKWFTSNSHNRLSSVASGKDGDVISAFKAADGVACVSISQDNMAFIEAAHPGAVIELIERLEAADKDGREYAILAGTNAARAEKAERERDELRKTLQATQGGATEAIKNVMRLQEEISRLNKESQRLSDQLGACDRQRLDWLKRALTAEAEIARRDAAAGEPVAYQIHSDLEGWRECTPERYAEVSARPLIDGKYSGGWLLRKLHTAAQPAVLPADITFESKGFVSLTSEDFAYNRALEDARKLGAQQQKVVEMPELQKWRKPDEVRAQSAYRNIIIQLLDAAGVKWEVKS